MAKIKKKVKICHRKKRAQWHYKVFFQQKIWKTGGVSSMSFAAETVKYVDFSTRWQ